MENIDVLNFVNDRYDDLKRKEIIQKNKNRLHATKIATKIGLVSLAVGIASGTVGYSIKKETKPVHVLSINMMESVDLIQLGGKMADAKEDLDEIDEFYNYIISNKISSEDIYSEISKICKSRGIDYNFAIVKLTEKYPEIFENSLKM